MRATKETASREPASILLCTPKTVFAKLLEDALKARSEVGWIQTTSRSEEVLSLARAKKPDAVLLDPSHPTESMFDLARALGRLKPRVPAIFVTDSPAIGWMYRALAAEAAGYLACSADVDEFVRAAQAVRRGLRYFSPSAATVVSNMATGTGGLPSLSARELGVLTLVCEGCSTKEISRELTMEPKTIDSIRARLMEKTRTKNAAALVRYACDEKFVDSRPRAACEAAEGGARARGRRGRGVPLKTH